MAKATAEKKPAAKKPAAATKEAAPAVEEKPVVKRSSARITLTQTKVIEAQFDTNSTRIEALDKKLVEVIEGYADKPEHMVAVKATEAREELAKAAASIVAGKDAFAEIGEVMRDFFSA